MMQQKKRNAIIQISLLFWIQWLSIIVIILNALALHASKESNQGLIAAADTGVQDFIVLIMGAISLFAVSLLLCLYFQMFFCLLENHSISPSKRVLRIEITFSVIIIVFWTLATAMILTHFNESSSCRKTNISTLFTKISFNHNNSLRACNLVDAMIKLAFITISIWFITLFVSIFSLVKICNYSSVVFSMMPYENADSKFQDISRSNSNKQQSVNDYHDMHSTTTLDQEDEMTIVVVDDKELIASLPLPPPITNNSAFPPLPHTITQQQGDNNNSENNDLHQSPPQEPEPVIITKKYHQYNFDFSFEPIQIDLMLPSRSELVGKRDYY